MQELLEKGMPEDGLGAVFSGIRTKNGPETKTDSRLYYGKAEKCGFY